MGVRRKPTTEVRRDPTKRPTGLRQGKSVCKGAERADPACGNTLTNASKYLTTFIYLINEAGRGCKGKIATFCDFLYRKYLHILATG